MLKLEQRLAAPKHGGGTRHLALSIAVTLLVGLFVWSAIASRRRVWTPAETPVAFWSWRSETPSTIAVNEAIRQTGARVLFQRAGQIDYESGKLSRIRRVAGPIPSNIPVHFVYNATRSFLKQFEEISDIDATTSILSTFDADVDRAKNDDAQVIGLQLDFDVPTRLLPRYAAILKAIRGRLADQIELSITGLPTWLDSAALAETLTACDFWVPQCYGAQIPERLDQPIPITTPEFVSRSVSRTRDLGVGFYAGLAAYGYAIHYSKDGYLIGLRGDLDPLLIVSSRDFELTDQTPSYLIANDSDEKKIGEWRTIYRARRDVIVDGTAIGEGESLLLDRPTAAGLRACARMVREQGGARLLGICVFRIPDGGDSTTLSLPEIASALSDRSPRFSLGARVDHFPVNKSVQKFVAVLELENNGTAALRTGEDSLTILVRVPSGLDSVTPSPYVSAEPVFDSGDGVVRCALKRANAVKLTVAWWPPGAKMTARFELRGARQTSIGLRYSATLDDGSAVEGSRTLAN